MTGRVVAASDVAGQPDAPLSEQLVLAIPLGAAGATLGLGAQPPAAERLRFLKAQLPAPSPAISTSVSDADGRYTLVLDPGAYVVCVADSEQQPPGFPATTRGCGQTEVRRGEVRQVDLSSGLGEVLLIER